MMLYLIGFYPLFGLLFIVVGLLIAVAILPTAKGMGGDRPLNGSSFPIPDSAFGGGFIDRTPSGEFYWRDGNLISGDYSTPCEKLLDKWHLTMDRWFLGGKNGIRGL